jgi:glycosyltransferase involved in cell wall biosynthesis
MKPKINIIAAANNFHFIQDIAEALRDDFEIDYFDPNSPIPTLLNLYDVIWFEWFDGYLPQILELGGQKPGKFIVRLHRYELFTPRTLALIQEITDSGNYKKIDKLVFVSEFVQQIGINQFPWMEEISTVIPNLIDHTKYEFKERKQGYNLLFLGRISYVKNLPLLLTLFYELYQINNNWKLHVIGDITDKELIYYKDNFIQKTHQQDNIKFYGKLLHEDVIRLMDNMHYIICTSIFEGHPVGIMEGMCKGLKPIIFSFPGCGTYLSFRIFIYGYSKIYRNNNA